jgi:XTP/dITP diphosphohydrolase
LIELLKAGGRLIINHQTLIVATKNKGKFKEIKNKLSSLQIKLIPLTSCKNPPVLKEDGKTFAENAIIKAVKIAKYYRAFALADDSGLEVDSLNGAPGIFSSRFVRKPVTSLKFCRKLLRVIKKVPLDDRGAVFKCVMAFATPEGKVFTREGKVHGRIGFKMEGENGFGYDPVFFIPKLRKTFAQIPLDLKNKISHRGRALGKIKKVIEKNMILR